MLGALFSRLLVVLQIRFLLPYLKDHHKRMGLAFLLALFSIALDHSIPWLLKLLLDDISNGDLQRIHLLLTLGVLFILISGVLGYWQRIMMARASKSLEAKLRDLLFKRIIAQPSSMNSHLTKGDQLQHLQSDLERIQEMTGPALLHLLRTFMTLVLSTILLWLLSPVLGVIGFLFFVGLAWASLSLIRRIYYGNKRIQEHQGTLAENIRNLLHGISVIKTSGRQEYFSTRLEDVSIELQNAQQDVAKSTSMVWPLITFLCGLGIAIALGAGAWLVNANELSHASLAAAILYLVRAQFPLVGLGIMASLIQRGRASLDRYMQFYHQLMDVPSVSRDASSPTFYSLQVKDLNFRYSQTENSSFELQNMNIELVPGKKIGIAGPTGSGKSTLIKLLCGELSIPCKTIFLNELDQSDLQQNDSQGIWRQLYSYAPQDGFLFSWQINENILLAQSNMENPALQMVLHKAGLASDIHLFPEGLGTLLGEKGVNLSGGQRQRVGLARALWHKAPVLLLDDVFSAVDPETEQTIVRHLFQENENQSICVVSHRLCILEKCDEILYLKNGKVVERGSHQELIQLQGEYALNWSLQQIEATP